MFDFVRRNTRFLLFVLFLLVIPSFVLFGVEGYMNMGDRGQVVARVDGQDIRQSAWDAAHRLEADRLRQAMPSIDPKLLDSPEARYGTLERMVRERVIRAAAQDDRLVTPDARLAAQLQRDPTIASLRGPDGRIDAARYRQLAAAQGLTPEGLEAQFRADLSNRQVLAGLMGTSFVTPAQAEVALDAYLQRREVQAKTLRPAEFAARVNPTDEEIQAFYQQNQALFQAPEQVKLEYLVLDLDTVMKGITVNESDLKTYYEQNIARQTALEERRASHILVKAPAGAPPADREAARKKAQELLAQVRQSPERFAELARQHSQDPGSAARGGDLDFFTRGAMTKPFEEAAFKLKKGEISDVVETDFGFHIIRLTDLRAPKQQTFEEVRPQLETELRRQQAQRKFAETADSFSNAVYEAADGLAGVAEKFKLPLRTAEGVTREPGNGASGVLANPKLMTAVFSPESLEKKRNTDAVEVGPSQLVSARVLAHEPARTLPLAEVKDRVREQLKTRRGIELAQKAGAEQLEALKANPQSVQLPAPVVISRENPRDLAPEVVEAAMRVDPSKLPGATGVDLGAQGYALVRVLKTLPREAPPAERAAQEREQVAQWLASAEGRAYYELLKERFKVKIEVPRPVPGATADANR
ncbi:SurA N-terminal domain-containing protein [Ramlibacter rhizophilus]|uniref:Periplasmic chaperone PpiD n=1 Tax=Ramlibacter rhizophilus TaxID=1781167 RepID=A0A4Z0BIA7_9BURK|nr:SurA N-terminal domain-containing protein [Ramlibacter rhizophilus]TFY98510.1 peptidyl-prolyl cis-trans isomerase [Ramlibacter rhizophilus]